MIETFDLIGKGLCIFLAAMLILLTGVVVAYLILNLGNKADAVPVVRCKDCKYTNAHGTDAHGNVDVHCVLFDLWMNEDFYCADGRRSE